MRRARPDPLNGPRAPAVLVAQGLKEPRAEAGTRPAPEAVHEEQPIDAVLKRLRLGAHGVERAVQQGRRPPGYGAPGLCSDRGPVRRDARVLR